MVDEDVKTELWRTITIYYTVFSTFFIIACFSIIMTLCDVKKKKNLQAPPGSNPTTPKSPAKPALLPSSMKNPSSPTPGGGGKNAKNAQKSTMGKSKAEKKTPVPLKSNKQMAGALDKTQEESKKSVKSNSKESGDKKEEGTGGGGEKGGEKDAKENNNNNNEKKEEEEKKSEPPPIVPEDKVTVLGNLDDVIKEKKVQWVKEIEDMGSLHEHDKVEKEPVNPEKHVVINEKKCKLYTTNNEETKEDDAPDDLI